MKGGGGRRLEKIAQIELDRVPSARMRKFVDALPITLYHVKRTAPRFAWYYDLDDITQEALIALWDCVPRLRAGVGNRSYLGKRIRGAIIDYTRRESPISGGGLSGFSHRYRPRRVETVGLKHANRVKARLPRSPDEKHENRQLLAAILRELPPEVRWLLEDIYLDHLSQRELAELHGVHESRIAQMKHEALERARRAGERVVRTRGVRI